MDSDYLAGVVDETKWHYDRLQELFPLLEIALDLPPEKMALLLKLYIEVSEPHRIDIRMNLAKIEKFIIGA